jgi:hypothetical protein
MRCFLDMDGVLVDFHRGVHDVHGLPYGRYPYPLGEWEIIKYTGIAEADFWKPCGREFWAGLPWTSEGPEILRLCEEAFGQRDICLLSTPCSTPGCCDGKRDWINQHTPEYAEKFLFGPTKYLCAHDEAVLVDDRERSTWRFNQAGGWAVTVPRPWNSLHNHDTLGGVIAQMKELGVLSDA